jgi:hypothetical protein
MFVQKAMVYMQLIGVVKLKQFNYLHQLSHFSGLALRPALRPTQPPIQLVLGLFLYLYIHTHIRPHGMVLNQLGTGKTLPLPLYIQHKQE